MEQHQEDIQPSPEDLALLMQAGFRLFDPATEDFRDILEKHGCWDWLFRRWRFCKTPFQTKKCFSEDPEVSEEPGQMVFIYAPDFLGAEWRQMVIVCTPVHRQYIDGPCICWKYWAFKRKNQIFRDNCKDLDYILNDEKEWLN